MKEETKRKIKEEVSNEISKYLDKINKLSGELELNEKQYVVIPLEEDFAGFVSKAIELTIEKCEDYNAD